MGAATSGRPIDDTQTLRPDLLGIPGEWLRDAVGLKQHGGFRAHVRST